MKITTIGGALVDIFFQSPDFGRRQINDLDYLTLPYAQKSEIESYHLTTGGGASNAAVALARRGHQVSIIAEIGHDNFGEIVRRELIAQNVDTRHIISERQEQTGCSVILLPPDSERTVLVSRAASAMLDDYDIPRDFLSTQDYLYLSSLGGNLNPLTEIWALFDQYPHLGLSWNPGSKELQELSAGALPLPVIEKGIFFVNQKEWQMVKNKQKEILAQFPLVVVTAGKDGGQLYYHQELYQEFPTLAHPSKVYDTTGAGDAFASAFTSTILYDCSLEEAIEAGQNNAASVIAHLGAKKGLLSF